MKMIEHAIRLEGSFGNRLPPLIGGQLLQHIGPTVRSAALMAIEGVGRPLGRPRRWVGAVSDIRFVGARADDAIRFDFLAPPLGEAAPELYRQRDFWREPPAADSTAFDLLHGVLEDIGADNADSDRYDDGVLHQLARFAPLFGKGGDGDLRRIALDGAPRRHRAEAVITGATIDHVHRLRDRIPQPQQVRLVGKLDMIRDSTRAFALKLDAGTEVPGVFVPGTMEDIQPLFRERVLVTGQLVYGLRPAAPGRCRTDRRGAGGKPRLVPAARTVGRATRSRRLAPTPRPAIRSGGHHRPLAGERDRRGDRPAVGGPLVSVPPNRLIVIA